MRPRTPPPPKASASANGAVVGDEKSREKEKLSVLGLRKKGIGVRTWLMIDHSGRAQLVEAGKHAIMRRACLPARDLRILDPLLSYPSTILGRERAIVVNLEHIKAIITAQEVLLLNSKDPAVVPVVLDLQRRLPLHFNSLGQQVPGDGGGGLSDNEGEGNHKGTTNSPPDDMIPVSPRIISSKLGPGLSDAGVSPSRATGGPSVLPFEFRALEVCLESACSYLDAETTMLEREAYPALDALTTKLSTLHLERVRQIKSRLVAISGRVHKVRDEIEQLLDDDEDMAEMYLTDKLLRMQIEGSLSPTSSHEDFNLMSSNNMESSNIASHKEANLPSGQHFDTPDSETVQDRVLKSAPQQSQAGALKEMSEGMEDLLSPGEGLLGLKRIGNHSSTSSSSSSSSNSRRGKPDVEELEMLLEAYFVQIDGTLNKLSALREYVDDTEDYINIMLDDKQNHLLQMGVLLTTATLVASAFIVVTGVFGMNINIDLFNPDTHNDSGFLWVVGGSLIGCTVIFAAAFAWYKYKRLIE